MLQTKVIVLGASRYKFPDEKTGEVIEGCKVHYVEKDFTPEDNSIGCIPQTAIMEFEYFETFAVNQVPGIYDAEMTVSLRGKKPTLKIIGFDYKSTLDFRKLEGQPTAPATVRN